MNDLNLEPERPSPKPSVAADGSVLGLIIWGLLCYATLLWLETFRPQTERLTGTDVGWYVGPFRLQSHDK